MKPCKVFIPTVGTGSRLGNMTENINKSLLSVANKPVISKIIDMFPKNTEFVIALGYKGDIVKQFLNLAYPHKKFNFIDVYPFEGEGSGLGLTLLTCKDYLQQPFFFCACDTLIEEKIEIPDYNMMGYAKREDVSQYRQLTIQNGNIEDILEKSKSKNNNTYPYIGLSYIKDYKEFWQAMQSGGNEAIAQGESYGLKAILKNGIIAEPFKWHDTGNLEEFEKAQKVFSKECKKWILPKVNEAIWFVGGSVIKFSNDKTFIEQRIKRSKILEGFVPKIISSSENMYMYNHIKGDMMSEIADISVFKNLLDFSSKFWTKHDLNDIEKTQFSKDCLNFYKNKTFERVELYFKNFNQTDNLKSINGLKMPKLNEILLNLDWDWLCSGLAGRFHGDFHFENILYLNSLNKFIFLDWRQNFGNSLEIGDIYYDFAKLLHGLIISHKVIVQNRYNVCLENGNLSFNFDRIDFLSEYEKYYYNWLELNGYDVKKVKTLTALIYLNIAALHHSPYSTLLYGLGKSMLYEN